MALPAAAQRKVDQAKALMQAPPPASIPDNPTPPPPAAPTDSEKLAQLEAKNVELAKQLETEKQRSSTFKGRLDSQVPTLQAQLKTAADEKAALEAKLNAKVEAGVLTSLTDEERRLVGDGLLEVTSKIAREIATQEIDGKLKPLNERTEVIARQHEAQYFATLDELVPNWEIQNDDPEFNDWLKQLDPASQRTRLDLLKRAEAGRQGYRVAEIFRAYNEEREIGARDQPPPAKQPSIDPRSGGGEQLPAGEPDVKLWKRSEISKFYADRKSGVYRGREAEARKIESDILAASREGRIREG